MCTFVMLAIFTENGNGALSVMEDNIYKTGKNKVYMIMSYIIRPGDKR